MLTIQITPKLILFHSFLSIFAFFYPLNAQDISPFKAQPEIDFLVIQNQKALELIEDEKYTQAFDVLNNIQIKQPSYLDNPHEATVNYYYYLGKVHYYLDDLENALESLQMSLKFCQQVFEEIHPQRAILYRSLGIIYDILGQANQAIEAYQQALFITQKISGKENPEIAIIYTNLGIVYEGLGNYEKALQLYHDALAIQKKSLEKGNPDFAYSFMALGDIYEYMGAHSKALNYYQMALSIFKEAYGTQDLSLAILYNNMGVLTKSQGSHEEALYYYQQALDIFKANLNKKSLHIADAYNNLGNVYSAKKDYAQALECFQKILDIHQKENELRADTYHNISLLYKYQGKYAQALDHAQESLRILRHVLASNHPKIASSQRSLGKIYQAQTKLDLAREYYQQALLIQKENFGNKHHELAHTYNALADLALAQEDYPQSIHYARTGLLANLKEAEYLPTHLPHMEEYFNARQFFKSLLIQAEALEQSYHQNPKQIQPLQEALQILLLADSLIAQTRGEVNTQEDKLALSQHVSQLTQEGILICKTIYEATNQAEYLHQAFYFSQKNKAHVLLEALNDAQAKNFGGIPDSLLQQESELKSSITFYEHQLALTSDSTQEVLYRQQLFNRNRQYLDLISQLEKNYPEYYALKYKVKTVSIQELQSVLDPHMALIDYFVGDSIVDIFTITKNSFHLESRSISHKIDRYLQGFRNGLVYRRKSTYALAARTLYKMLFPQKIKSSIKQLIILPDATLSTIPFEALLTKTMTTQDLKKYERFPYLIKKYQISYDYSPVLFYENAQKQSSPPSQLNDFIAHAPVFAEDAQQGVSRSSFHILHDFDALDTTRTRSILNDRNQVSAIPATETEVEAIYDLFARQKKLAQIHTHQQSHEYRVKSGELSQYRFIHFATHGFVNPDEPKLSGILLMYDSTQTEDGILFMGEIYNLDLQADLVTLSACETGLGKILPGEGIIGLAQAFIYAGAKNVMVSLWKVADNSTAQLMIDFYDALLHSKEENFSKALYEAKLKMIKEGTFASPYYWSPFVLIGK